MDKERRIRVIWLVIAFVLLGMMGWLVVDKIVSPTGYFLSGINSSKDGICSDISIIVDYDINEPILVNNKTVRINPNRIDELEVPPGYSQLENIDKEPYLYDYTEGRDNIVIIGDSYSEGAGVQYNETYAYSLSKQVDLNIINLGLGGYNTKMELERFKQVGMSYNPKIVILQYFANDMENINEFRKLYGNTFLELEKSGIYCDRHEPFMTNPILSRISDIDYAEIIVQKGEKMLKDNALDPMEELGKLSINNKFKVILLIIRVEDFQRGPIMDVSKKYGFDIIDVPKELNIHRWTPPITLSDTDPHFSAQTNKRLADLLYPYLQKND